jgi:hypothetical protein
MRRGRFRFEKTSSQRDLLAISRQSLSVYARAPSRKEKAEKK